MRSTETKRRVRNGAGKSPKKGPTVGGSAIAGLREGLAYVRSGKPTSGMIVHKAVDVAAVRKSTGLSQAKFAEEFGLKATAVRAWEQGTRSPDPAAQTLLRVIEQEPEVVRRAVKGAA